jgi:quinol monooxygenase YgiN
MKAKFICSAIFAMMFSMNFAVAQHVTRNLDENVFFIVEVKIRPNQFDNFVKVAKKMSEVVRSKEPGALNYEWTISRDSTMCYILERYESTKAAMVHMKVFNDEFAEKFNEVVEMTGFTIYGKPGPELIEALGAAAEASRVPVAGFAR